jgi:hypothetical protein
MKTPTIGLPHDADGAPPRYDEVLIVLSTVIRIKRSLDGGEIDDVISGFVPDIGHRR